MEKLKNYEVTHQSSTSERNTEMNEELPTLVDHLSFISYMDRNGKPCISVEDAKKLVEIMNRQLADELEGMKKKQPKNIKQEIWGGEGGLPNTIIESPDVFGIKYTDGFNQAISAVQNKLRGEK